MIVIVFSSPFIFYWYKQYFIRQIIIQNSGKGLEFGRKLQLMLEFKSNKMYFNLMFYFFLIEELALALNSNMIRSFRYCEDFVKKKRIPDDDDTCTEKKLQLVVIHLRAIGFGNIKMDSPTTINYRYFTTAITAFVAARFRQEEINIPAGFISESIQVSLLIILKKE